MNWLEANAEMSADGYELATAVVAGNREAWKTFYSEYRTYVLQLARRHAATEADAEEISEDFCAEAVERLRRYEGRCSLHGWLAVVVPNVVRDWYRRRAKEVVLTDLAPDSPDGDPPALDSIARQVATPYGTVGIEKSRCQKMLEGSLRAAWAKLGEAERALLEYRFFHNLKSREIANIILKVGEDVVSKRLKRALEQLGAAIRRHALGQFKHDIDSVRHCVELVIGDSEISLGD